MQIQGCPHGCVVGNDIEVPFQIILHSPEEGGSGAVLPLYPDTIPVSDEVLVTKDDQITLRNSNHV